MKCLERDYLRAIFRIGFHHNHGGDGFTEPAANAFDAWSGVIKNGYYVGKEIGNTHFTGIRKAHAGPDSFTGA
jgi:hypothetical protein